MHSHELICKLSSLATVFYVPLLPPAAVVEVIESVLSVCVSVCLCSNRWTAWRMDTKFGTGMHLESQFWAKMREFKLDRSAKGLRNIRRGRCVNAQAFSCFICSFYRLCFTAVKWRVVYIAENIVAQSVLIPSSIMCPLWSIYPCPLTALPGLVPRCPWCI